MKNEMRAGFESRNPYIELIVAYIESGAMNIESITTYFE